MAAGGGADQRHGPQVEIERAVPGCAAHGEEVLARAVAGVVHDDVEATERGDRSVHCGFRAGLGGQVLDDHRGRRGTFGGDRGDRCGIDIDQCKGAATRGQGECGRPAEPAGGAGDHCSLRGGAWGHRA